MSDVLVVLLLCLGRVADSMVDMVASFPMELCIVGESMGVPCIHWCHLVRTSYAVFTVNDLAPRTAGTLHACLGLDTKAVPTVSAFAAAELSHCKRH